MASSIKGENKTLEKVSELLKEEKAAEAQQLFREISVAGSVEYL